MQIEIRITEYTMACLKNDNFHRVAQAFHSEELPTRIFEHADNLAMLEYFMRRVRHYKNWPNGPGHSAKWAIIHSLGLTPWCTHMKRRWRNALMDCVRDELDSRDLKRIWNCSAKGDVWWDQSHVANMFDLLNQMKEVTNYDIECFVGYCFRNLMTVGNAIEFSYLEAMVGDLNELRNLPKTVFVECAFYNPDAFHTVECLRLLEYASVDHLNACDSRGFSIIHHVVGVAVVIQTTPRGAAIRLLESFAELGMDLAARTPDGLTAADLLERNPAPVEERDCIVAFLRQFE